MTITRADIIRKAREEGISIDEQIEAEIAELDDEIRGLDASVSLYLKELDEVRTNIARCQDQRRTTLDLRDELMRMGRCFG